MSAREEVLARIRRALADAPVPPPVPRDYRRTGSIAPAALQDRLTDRLTDYRAQVTRVADAGLADAGLAEAVAAQLAGATTVVVPSDAPAAWLAACPVAVRRDEPPIPVSELDAPGVTVLTGCVVAIAETGTLVLDGGVAQGRRVLSLVPDHHVCVVRAAQVVASVPEALARLPAPHRPLTLISGPSATSDIELNRVEGVHGPRRLAVILVD